MSPPAPFTVHTPFTTSCVPARAGLPTSWQVQPAGQAPGGGGALLAIETLANTAVFTCPLCEVTARPASSDPPTSRRGTTDPANPIQPAPAPAGYACLAEH